MAAVSVETNQGDPLAYRFSIETICKSKVKPFLKIKKIKNFIFGEHYRIIYELKNESDKTFSGDSVFFQIFYQSNVFHDQTQRLRRIENDGMVTIEDDRPAVGVGYAVFYGKIIADDGEPVKNNRIWPRLEGEPFHAIFIRTWSDLHTNYALLASIFTYSGNYFVYFATFVLMS